MPDVREQIGAEAHAHFAYLFLALIPLDLVGSKGKCLLFTALYHLANTKFIKYIEVFKPLL